MQALPLVLDLAGTFVFALSGALAGAKRKLDLFGILVLSFAAANSGGITRDLLIGVVPPGAIADWRYLGVSLFAGVITFFFSSLIVRMSNAVLIFDGAGLALFAVTGASKAIAHGLNPLMAIVLGMVTGIGGGMVRDVLLAEIPTVLRAELLCGRGACGRGHRGGWAHVAVASRAGDGGGADFMLLAARHGNEAWLAASGCEVHGLMRPGRPNAFGGSEVLVGARQPAVDRLALRTERSVFESVAPLTFRMENAHEIDFGSGLRGRYFAGFRNRRGC
ncbi:putative membrane protein YeiH [Bradyrhizobium sp. LM6.11]